MADILLGVFDLGFGPALFLVRQYVGADRVRER